MVTKAALIFEADARPLKEAAREVEQALDGVKRKSTESMSAYDQAVNRLDETWKRMEAENEAYESRMRKAADTTKDFGTTADTAATHTSKFKDSLFTVQGVSERVESKLMSLGKAAIGIFAVDVAAKVLGFSSALDAINKAADAAAASVRDLLNGPLDEAALKARVDATAKLASEIERIQSLRAGYMVDVGSQRVNLGRFSGSAYDEANLEAKRLIDEYAAAQAKRDENQRLLTGRGAGDPNFTRARDEAAALMKSIEDSAQQRIIDAANLGRAEDKVLEVFKNQFIAMATVSQAEKDRLEAQRKQTEELAKQKAIQDAMWQAALDKGAEWQSRQRGLDTMAGVLAPFTQGAIDMIPGVIDLNRRKQAASDYDKRHPHGPGSTSDVNSAPADPVDTVLRQQQAYERMLQSGLGINNALTQTQQRELQLAQISRALGDELASGFESAVFSGQNLRGVLNGIANDLERMMFRQLVTQPLGNWLTQNIFSAAGGGGLSMGTGSGSGDSGYYPGGQYALGTTLWGPHVAVPVGGGPAKLIGESGPEDVVRSTARGGRGGGPITIHQHFYGRQDADTMKRSGRQIMDDLRRRGA